jgi:hypothetical protein
MTEDTQGYKTKQNDSRIDVRFPEEVHEAIKLIAEKDGAKIHHRSGEVILSPTVVKLVQLGIRALSDDSPISLSDCLPDNISYRVLAVEQELSDLKKFMIVSIGNLSDKVSEPAPPEPEPTPEPTQEELELAARKKKYANVGAWMHE